MDLDAGKQPNSCVDRAQAIKLSRKGSQLYVAFQQTQVSQDCTVLHIYAACYTSNIIKVLVNNAILYKRNYCVLKKAL